VSGGTTPLPTYKKRPKVQYSLLLFMATLRATHAPLPYTMSKLIQAILDFFKWFAEQASFEGALFGIVVVFFAAAGMRLYFDRRADMKRLEELREKNRTIDILRRELDYYKAKEVVREYGLSLDEALRCIGAEVQNTAVLTSGPVGGESE